MKWIARGVYWLITHMWQRRRHNRWWWHKRGGNVRIGALCSRWSGRWRISWAKCRWWSRRKTWWHWVTLSDRIRWPWKTLIYCILGRRGNRWRIAHVIWPRRYVTCVRKAGKRGRWGTLWVIAILPRRLLHLGRSYILWAICLHWCSRACSSLWSSSPCMQRHDLNMKSKKIGGN